jgi:hypothetical protein
MRVTTEVVTTNLNWDAFLAMFVVATLVAALEAVVSSLLCRSFRHGRHPQYLTKWLSVRQN